MKFRNILATAIIVAAAGNSLPAAAEYAIIPEPASVVTSGSKYRLPSRSAEKIARKTTDKSLASEAYRLVVTPKGVEIAASDKAGFFYGLQTLQQIIAQADGNGEIECLTIEDAPRYDYRGVMLDVVRCYYPVDDIKRLIDAAAMLKLNTLHLHLTDDNGWRMEIKKYPRLTEVGAWSVDRPELFPGRLNARSADEPATIGGFYTQKELRDIVKYAAARNITVIPEIEMPAHSAAAIASYPELHCPVVDKFVGVFPGIGGKDASIILCAGNDSVYTFITDVLDEVMSVFPSEYIHLGGDEANKSVWEKCPKCNARIEKEGLHDHEELQAYFMDRINSYVHSKGRKTIGWDEVTYGNPKEEMTIMGWQGDGSVAVKDAIKNGRRFIMTPAKTFYLIRYQGPQWFEPFTYFGNNTLADVYNYRPLTPEQEALVGDKLWGVQGSLWSEFCSSSADMFYLVFPRLLGVADVAWRSSEGGKWEQFLRGVDLLVPRLQQMGIEPARSMFNLDHKVTPAEGALKVELSCIRPDVEIRYSLNDSTFSNPYTAPLTIAGDATVYASTFRNGTKEGRTLVLPLTFNKATGRPVKAVTECRNGLAYTLTNGLRASDRNSDFEWAGWHNGTAEFVVDLGEVMPVNSIELGNLLNTDICISAPLTTYFYLSPDNARWELVATVDGASTYNRGGAERPAIKADNLNAEGRYVKVVAVNPGIIPDGFAREGTATWLYFDEIVVR